MNILTKTFRIIGGSMLIGYSTGATFGLMIHHKRINEYTSKKSVQSMFIVSKDTEPQYILEKYYFISCQYIKIMNRYGMIVTFFPFVYFIKGKSLEEQFANIELPTYITEK